MAATQEELSLDEGKARTEEAYAYLQRKKQDSTRPYADSKKIWLLQQTLLLSSHRSDAEVLECLGLSLARKKVPLFHCKFSDSPSRF